MLILSRNVQQRIMINDDIVITIAGISGNSVRIGVDAPENMSIHREEIYNKIKRGAAIKVNNGNTI